MIIHDSTPEFAEFIQAVQRSADSGPDRWRLYRQHYLGSWEAPLRGVYEKCHKFGDCQAQSMQYAVAEMDLREYSDRVDSRVNRIVMRLPLRPNRQSGKSR